MALKLKRKPGELLTFTVTEPCQFTVLVDCAKAIHLVIDAPAAVVVDRPEARMKTPKRGSVRVDHIDPQPKPS